jgi:hypothetical protein
MGCCVSATNFSFLVNRVIAKHVHVKAQALADQRQPDSPGSDYGDCLPRDLIAYEPQKRVPRAPLLLADYHFAVPHAA